MADEELDLTYAGSCYSQESDGEALRILNTFLLQPESWHPSLIDQGTDFELSIHEPVRTSEQAAAVRNVDPRSGAKAMLLAVKPGNPFILAVVSATEKMDSKKMKKVG